MRLPCSPDVEHDERRPAAAHRLQGFFAVTRGADLVAIVLQDA